MAWQTPKTNWAAGNVPAASDFNRIEGNIQELQDTKETPAGAQAKAEAAAGMVRAELDAHKADYANPHQVKAEQVFALGGVPAGTTFPTSPAPYTLFFRTDLNKLFVYLP